MFDKGEQKRMRGTEKHEEHDAAEQAQQREREAQEQEKEKAKLSILRDNLRLRTIAQYRALKDGDILTYDDIEERVVGKASLTGLVQSRSSFERFERFKAGGFYSSK